MTGGLTVALFRDVLARTTRIAEALDDADLEFARQALDDLSVDVWRVVEAEERSS